MKRTIPQKILFRHCDPAGMVFYPRYFEIINDCIEVFFDTALGLPFDRLHEKNAIPTVRIDTQFKAPSRLGEEIGVTVDCTGIGRSSMNLTITGAMGDEPRFEARSTIVFVDLAGKPTGWPQPVIDTINGEAEGTT